MFVSFEGIDGSGKTTQARMLAEALRARGLAVTLTREPGGSPGAEEIRRLVLTGDPARWSPETEILLFTAARRDHLERTIRPALARGEVVVTDRFADSTRMYQGTARGDLRKTVDQLHELMIGVEPDLTFVIDMDAKAALGRSLARMVAMQRAEAASNSALAAAAAASGSADSAASAAAFAAASAGRAHSIQLAVDLIASDQMPEDRFETFGPLFQSRLRAGFLALAADHPGRFRVIDGARDPAAVAADVLAAFDAA